MENTLKILMLTPEFNLLCGRSKSVFNLSTSLMCAGHNVTIATNGGDNINKIKEKDLKFLLLNNYSDGMKPIVLLKSIIELRKILSLNNYDIVHSHHRFFDLVVYIVNIIFFKDKLKSIFTAHNIYKKKRPLQFKSHKIIAVNNFVKQSLVKNFSVNSDKIFVVYNFLLQDEINELANISENKIKKETIILASGRFETNKNYFALLEAINLCNNNVKLYIVGEGDQELKLKSLIRENKLNVKLLKPNKNYFKLLKVSDICVLPSFSEGTSYFLLESLAANKYILASNIGGNIEILKGYEKYNTFNPNSIIDLSNKIFSICKEIINCKVTNSYTLDLKFTESFNIKLISNIYRH